MPSPSFTDAEWRRLVKSQNQIEEEEEAILAKLLWLRKQKHFKEVAELEELERREVEERERLEKERLEQERLESEQNERAAESTRAATGVPLSAVADG
ncbi:hypothetical protein POX_e06610 [Penicillium oxalicum]|uniref:hypothetical protein n=1 Tax=Penicillium oxalicum TaxID=69781 RepID=UPI0020B71076|nr:hypothetical protein POX_e06610 [Penicillium oxalicum]KAI2788591.1 hypothetical protein POX_e06610 [Penicillium oxalicum]